MDKKLLLTKIFFKKIKYFPNELTKNLLINDVKKNKDGIYEIFMFNDTTIQVDELIEFLNAVNSNFRFNSKVIFSISKPIFKKYIIKKYLEMISSKLLGNETLRLAIHSSSFKIKDKKVTVQNSQNDYFKLFENSKQRLTDILFKFGFIDVELDFVYLNGEEIINESKQDLQKQTNEYLNNQNNKNEVFKGEVKNHNKYSHIPISKISTSGEKNISTIGIIFEIKHINTRTGRTIYTIKLTDKKEAIIIKIFADDSNKNKIQNFKNGDTLKVSGLFAFDSYSKVDTLIVKKFEKNRDMFINISDNRLGKKRIELSMRTKMNTMDGIENAHSIIKNASQMGHQAIAIVDNSSIQSFPDFYYASKESNVKPIYGSSFNVVHKNSRMLRNPNGKTLFEETYVVFDLETTELSPIAGEIIEFGATVVKKGKIIDTEQFFMKPTKNISEFTTKLTGITNEMVFNSMSEKEGIIKLKDYIKNYTLVAHNAKFDITFLEEKFDKYNLGKLNNQSIDSLITSRFLNEEKRRFNLQTVSKIYGVNYDNEIAHRADYDAEVLAQIWLKQINQFLQKGIHNTNDLFKINNPSLISKSFHHEVTMLAKNQDGLKELFKFISSSSTDQFYGGPKLFLEDLGETKNILLGSGGINGYLHNLMFYSSRENIKKAIKLFDYIEILPFENFKYLIDRGNISEKNIKEIIKFVIEEANKINKLVVAISDARYFDKSQKVIHEIYIHAKGIGGRLHKLFDRRFPKKSFPTQIVFTTDEMLKSFSWLENTDLVEDIVINNTHEISSQINKNIKIIRDKLYTPTFGDENEKLTKLIYTNAKKMYGKNLPIIVEKRIERELKPIVQYGFSIIYWISSILVKKSLEDGYLVGSRGSVGSSLVATFSEITKVNPLPPHHLCTNCKNVHFYENSLLNSGYDLENKNCDKCGNIMSKEGQNIPFETFLGFEADKVPDIDLNFSGIYQSTIHKEVRKIFGDKNAFRAGTISTVASKTAYGYVKNYEEMTEKIFSNAFREYLVTKVEGTKRTTGQHPGGIIVIPEDKDVEFFSPINYPADNNKSDWKTTHLDFHAIHDNVLKLDLLGHDDPTAIKNLEKLTGLNVEEVVNFSDKKVISLFSSTEALGIKPEDIRGEKTGVLGIPEFGTSFVRRMLSNVNAKSFGDLISLSGLSHGTDVWTGNAEEIIKLKLADLSTVVSCRDDIMIDLISKGVDSKKSFTIMENVRKGKGLTSDDEKLLIDSGVEIWYIESLKKIKYMFPKAHATAYVMMAFMVSWFKVYKPLAFYSTYLSSRSDYSDLDTFLSSKDKINQRIDDINKRKNSRGEDRSSNKEIGLISPLEIILEAKARGIKFNNVDIYKSDSTNWIINHEKNTLTAPFDAIDGLGESAAISVIEARKNGPFISIEDLSSRTKLSKTHIKKLKETNVLNNLPDSNQMDIFSLF
ncbi:MAG: PolC-type DNA polymerase III [Mollicutes bacterium PWAP]|nr:PolC-type DNA polymerase III [Mollicutes bacterium PWAP]